MMGKTSSAVKDRYNAKVYDNIMVRVSKGSKDKIKAHAQVMGESVNGFISRSISEAMERDSGSTALKEARGISLSPDTIKAAQEAAQAAGEGISQFLDRAVTTQAQRDILSRRIGGDKANE